MMNSGMPNNMVPANTGVYPNMAQPAVNYDPNQMMMAQSNYTQAAPQQTVAYPTTNMPVQYQNMSTPIQGMPVSHFPNCPVPVPNFPTPVPNCPVPVPNCPDPMQHCGPTICVPIAAPVATPALAAMPQQQVQKVTTPIATTQATTATHKKTTFVEAYVKPYHSEVPLMQPTVEKKVTKPETYPVSEDIVYVEQQPVKSSTMQDYNLYLMEKEYYDEMEEPTYYKKTKGGSREPRQDGQLTCENLPLATTYVRSQTYTGFDNPTQTLQQGTTFNALYDNYTPRKVAGPTIFRLKGGATNE